MKKFDIDQTEYAPFYANYIKNCGEKELVEELQENYERSMEFFSEIPVSKFEFAYSEGKWTIKEIVQHIIDSERIFNYRALRFARQDNIELPGFDENEYVLTSNANERDFKDLTNEFAALRQSTLCLFKSFNEAMLLSSGIANGNNMSVRALGFIIVGHTAHHCRIISERYL